MSNAENVPPGVTEAAAGGGPRASARSLAREVARLCAAPPAGVRVLHSDQDLSDLLVLLDGPAGTPYAGGVFKVQVSLSGWPAAPRARFLTKVFHPNVSLGGEVCVSTLARDWRPDLGLAHALLAISSLLIAPNPESALNAEAAALLADRYEVFARRAAMLTEIHAQPHMVECGAGVGASECGSNEEPSAKRRAGPPTGAPVRPSTATVPPLKPQRDKRRILKRL